MTLNEFKAWIEGYTDAFEVTGAGVLTVKKIKEKLRLIEEDKKSYVQQWKPIGGFPSHNRQINDLISAEKIKSCSKHL